MTAATPAVQPRVALLVYEAAVDLHRSHAARSHLLGLAGGLEGRWPGFFTVLVPAFGEEVELSHSGQMQKVPVRASRLGGFVRYEWEKAWLLWRWLRECGSLTLLTRFSLLNVGALIARAVGARVVLEVNGLPHQELRLRGGLAAFAWPSLLSLWAQAKAAHAVVAVSQGIADSLEAVGIAAEVVPNGVDAREYEDCDDKEVGTGRVLYVGSLAPWQDVELVLHAFRRLVDRGGRAWRLTVVGDGERSHALRALSRSLGLEHVVEFTGSLDRAGVRQWLGWASVCVVPRAQHAPPCSPLKLYEYLAANRPTVAADLHGMSAVSTPLLSHYRPGDVMSLAEAVVAADDVSSLPSPEIAGLRAEISWGARAEHVVTVLAKVAR